jgi:hypothetical protein
MLSRNTNIICLGVIPHAEVGSFLHEVTYTYPNNWIFIKSSVRPSDLADVEDDSYGSVGGMKRILLYWNKKFRSILEESREWVSKAVPAFMNKVLVTLWLMINICWTLTSLVRKSEFAATKLQFTYCNV